MSLKITDNALIEAFRNWIHLRGLSPETETSYIFIAKSVFDHVHSVYGFMPDVNTADQVKGFMLSSYVSSLTCSDKTKNYYIGLVKIFFHFLHASGYTASNPSDVLMTIKIHCDDDTSADELDLTFYSSQDVSDLIGICRGKNRLRDRAIIALLCGTGLRASELCSLNVQDWMNMQRRHIYVKRKGGAKRWVPVAEYAIGYVEEYLKDRSASSGVQLADPLFPAFRGQRLTRSNLYKTLKKWQVKADLKPGVHIFRHTALTGIAKAEGLEAAKAQANHSSTAITQRYVHATAQERLSAVDQSAIAAAFTQNT